MNAIRAIVYIGVRGYRRPPRRIRPDAAGIRGKLQLVGLDGPEQAKLDLEDVDPDDTAEFESDFSTAHEYYDKHEREVVRSKEKLQLHITARKYFKTVEPSFVTLVEREEIKRLHRSDPEDWTVERLSESFPISCNGIKKILKDKWKPKTVERALAYDKKIADNWKQFHAGKIIVSPMLREHLRKFGDRKIDMKDRDVLVERFVAKKMEFPEPKTKVFSTIVDYLDADNRTQSQNLIEGEKSTQTSDAQAIIPTESNVPLEEKKTKGTDSHASKQKFTFTEFVEVKYDEISKKSKQEAEVLLDTYKKHVKSTAEKAENAESVEVAARNYEIAEHPSHSKSSVQISTLDSEPALPVIEDKDNHALSTYVAKWEKLHDIEPTYYYPIKIPKDAYRKGKIYRIGDCYYDRDGEFLYRVPGLRS